MGINSMLSIVLPCYNEYKNIKLVLEKFSNALIKENESYLYRKDIEVIIVDNGSYDGSKELIKDLNLNYEFCRSIRIEENKGYGYGIQEGIKISKGDIIGWTHADLQCDPNDVIKGFQLMKSSETSNGVFVKGLRKKRPIKDTIFTKGMSLFESLLFLSPLSDINGQPNIMPKKLYNLYPNPPNDFSFDLYYYILARKSNYLIKRFPVYFQTRIHGSSSWNINWKSKLRFIKRTILFSFKLRFALLKDDIHKLLKSNISKEVS